MPRTPSILTIGSVNSDPVVFVLDGSWDGLTVFAAFRNDTEGVERHVLLGDDLTCTIPWECLTQAGTMNVGLLGLRGSDVVKPTIWLTYGKVVEGVDPESGSDPKPPTPSWEQQMVEQATQANQAAQDAKDYAQQVAESIESAGPYAEEAKEAAEAAKASQEETATSAQQASQAAKDAQAAAGSIGDAVQRAEQAATVAGSAQRAAETAKEGAAQSAGTAQSAAVAAVQSAGTAQDAATKAGEYMSSAETAAGAATDAAIAAGQLQQGAQTAAQEAANARDQATTAATTAQDHATAASTAKDAAEQAATTAGNAQSGAAQSAQAASNSAQAAERAKQEAQNAAAAFPAPSQEFAGMVPIVNPEGDGYIFGEAGGGGVGGELLQTISGENYGNIAYNFPEGKNTFFVVGTLNVNADKGTVVVYQNCWTYDGKAAYLPFWDFYGQEGKTLRVHLIFERVRIGADGTSLLRLSGVVSSVGKDGPGRRAAYLQSPWTDVDSSGLKLGRFVSFEINGTFDSVNLRVYGA